MSEETALSRPQKVGYLQLTFLIYGAVCGGAFGLEAMIGSSGPGISLVILMVMPFIFSVPLSLAVSELTAAFPVEGGNYRWSRMALGNFWGFQAGWWSWASAVATSASFAALFANYVKDYMRATWDQDMTLLAHWLLKDTWDKDVMSALVHWLLCLALIWAMHWVNVRGIEMVGTSAVIMSVLLLVPFVVMTVLGLTHWHTNPFQPFTAPGKGIVGFGTALAAAIWLYSGYEKLSCAAEEVDNPQTTFPPALFSAALLAMLSYFLPTVCALAMLGNWTEWTDGYFTTAALKMGGLWLQQVTVVAGLLSNALLLNVTMMAASRTLLTMSEDAMIPKALASHNPRYGTPTAALLAGSLLLSLLSLFPFQQLLVIYGWFTMTATLLIYLNVWRMRRLHPEAPRPFRVPGGTRGLLTLCAPTVFLAVLAMTSNVMPDWHLDRQQLAVALVALMSGPLLYVVVARPSQNKEEFIDA